MNDVFLGVGIIILVAFAVMWFSKVAEDPASIDSEEEESVKHESEQLLQKDVASFQKTDAQEREENTDFYSHQ